MTARYSRTCMMVHGRVHLVTDEVRWHRRSSLYSCPIFYDRAGFLFAGNSLENKEIMHRLFLVKDYFETLFDI